MSFIAYRKAVVYGEQKFVLQALKNRGVQDKYSRVIEIIYNYSNEKIKMDTEGEKLRFSTENKQGDPISPQSSPVYWNTYSEK
jgi:hypothetical protein